MKPVACTRSHTPGLAGVGEGHDVHLHSLAQGRRRRESQEWVAPSVTAYNVTRYKHLIVTCNAEKPVAWKLLFLSPFRPEPTPDQESRLPSLLVHKAVHAGALKRRAMRQSLCPCCKSRGLNAEETTFPLNDRRRNVQT